MDSFDIPKENKTIYVGSSPENKEKARSVSVCIVIHILFESKIDIFHCQGLLLLSLFFYVEIFVDIKADTSGPSDCLISKRPTSKWFGHPWFKALPCTLTEFNAYLSAVAG